MNQPKLAQLPIFILEGPECVSVYDSLELAENALEPIDVLEGIYVGYDAEGRSLNITPDGYITKIELAEVEPTHADALRRILIEFFVRRGVSACQLRNASLQDLIMKSLDYKERY